MKINWKSALEIIGAGLLLVLVVKVVMILLPVFFYNPPKARQPEGKTVTGSMNRAQQAYFEENNKLTTNFEELGLGIKSETEDYIYKIVSQSNPQSVMNIGQSKSKRLKNYVGFTYITKINGKATPVAKLCETKQPLNKVLQMPKFPTSANNFEDFENIECPPGFESLHMPQFYKKAI